MLSDEIKDQIRTAYTAIVERKGLSPRWGQRQMIAEIANTLGRIPEDPDAIPESSAVCVIEAGTGTGKTIAYAVAAIPLAQALGKRLVVATATIALQEQFVDKDLPDIRSHSGLDFDFVLAKGRRRYVCLSKLDRLMADSEGDTQLLPLYPDEAAQASSAAAALPVYTAMIDALGRGQWDGDRDNWPDALDEGVWLAATTDHSGCSGRRCPNISQCSFYRARDALQTADIIVTNHDLVLSDLALGGGAILSPPEDSIYIFDEGHHLPDKALSHFSGFCRLHTTVQWLEESGKLLPQAASLSASILGLGHPLSQLPEAMEQSADGLRVAEQQVAALFEDHEFDERRDDQVLRFEHGEVPSARREMATTLAGSFQQVVDSLNRAERLLESALDEEFADLPRDDVETWHLNIGAMLGRAESVLALWQAYAIEDIAGQPPMARWITMLGGDTFGFDLRCSPILAADILDETLWTRAAGVVITSATLSALNSFERFILHSGSPRDGVYKQVASPFDYGSAVFSVPAMDCDPSDATAHTQALIDMLPRLLDPAQGSLVLFSSRRQMLDVYDGVEAQLGSWLLMQGDYSKQEVLRRHKEAIDAGSGSAIFGLASFAEGVDLPGDYCRHVVIAKIPFAVPDSPLEAALAEWVEAQGRNAFMEISVPDAALRVVQAAGRLLRTETDSGLVTLLDRRIITRRYGRAILDSLPPFQRNLA